MNECKKVNVACEKNGHKSIQNFVKFSMDDCGAFLQYKWVAKDPTMPKNISGRRKHCLNLMHRDSPFASPHNSDDEAGVEERNKAEFAVAKASMGNGQELANNNYLFDKEEEEEEEVERGSHDCEVAM